MTNEELEDIYDRIDGGIGKTSRKLAAHIKSLEAEIKRLREENSKNVLK